MTKIPLIKIGPTKIAQKLNGNADNLRTEGLQTAHVSNRLIGSPFDRVMTRGKTGVANPYETVNEPLNYLAQVHEDPTRKS